MSFAIIAIIVIVIVSSCFINIYRESIAIEKIIQDNSQAREDWLHHQLNFNSDSYTFNDDDDFDDEVDNS